MESRVKLQEGVYRVCGTRVALDSIVYLFRQGRSPESIQDSFPSLSLAQVYAAISFYLDHEAEVGAYLARNEAAEQESSEQLAREFPKGAALKSRVAQRHAPKLAG